MIELPSRARPRGDELIELLLETGTETGATASTETRGDLNDGLVRRYGGPLSIPLRPDRPTIVANFVQTIDGVVSMDAGRSGGGDVSGFSPADRFVMGLLRTLADVVLVGAGTFRASGGRGWTPARAFPAAAAEFAEQRRGLGLAPNPTTLVVTSTGELDPNHPGLQDPAAPAVIAGPDRAVERLAGAGLPAHVRLETLAADRPAGVELPALARRLGARIVLSEAGPHLAGELISAGAIDELFLTLSPQLAGRDAATHRLSLVEGTALWPASPRWLRLLSARRAGDHLLLRYRFEESGNEG